MQHQSTAVTQSRARNLRRAMTDAETRVWSRLRGGQLGAKFRRQHPLGVYIADFACLSPQLIVEIDGSQHAGSARDVNRTAELNQLGFRVLRFWNDDVLRDMPGVCDTILAYVRDTSLQPWR